MFKTDYFTSINDVPVEVWDRLASRQAVSLESNHLRAVEVSKINDIHPYYFISYNNNEPVGIAYCFAIQVNLAKLANIYPQKVIETIKMWKPNFMEMRILEVGHIASLGKTIEVSEPYLPDFLNSFSEKIDEISSVEKIDLCIIRDINASHYNSFRILQEKGFFAVMGFPVARMQLRWNGFEGYLESLKAKKRSNFKQRRNKLIAPEIEVEIIEDYAPYSERLAELWTNVAQQNNGYEHERLTSAYFKAMAEYLKGRSHVVAIKKNGEIVTYGLNLIGDDEYFGMAEGLDYSLRDKYDLYANNIFEALDVACKLGKKSFNIGITTYDYKASLGAELDPCIYFIKAIKNPCFSAVYKDLINKSIEQPENCHHVFRDSSNLTRKQLKETEAIIQTNGSVNLDPFKKHLQYTRIDTARAADLYTFCPVFESAQEPVIKHNGRDVIMLGTNAYLGLATHPEILKAAHDAIDKYGSGCSGSPMLNGTLDIHKQLSENLAEFTHKESALIFSTGYQTSVGIVSALVNRNDVLIMDERNHASLVDGGLLSRATLARYKHNNTESLETLLKKYENRPTLVVADSLFSMEGTIINLPEIVRLVKKYKARLMLDESHAIGVMGPNGKGVAEHYGLLDEVDIIMGTFSKSFASIGGFAAGDAKIIDTLKHTSRAHIFSASLPPSAVAIVLTAMKIMKKEPERRIQLIKNANYLAKGLEDLGYNIDYHGSAIIPVFCGHELVSVAAFHKLFEKGVFVNPVTSPAVPKNQEILRISLMASHTNETLNKALEIFQKVRTKYWPSKN